MKKIGYLLGITGLVLSLAACGNNNSKQANDNSQDKDSYSAKMQNSSSNKSANSTASKQSSSSKTASKDPQKKSRTNLANYHYTVPAAERHQPNYTKNGNLTKPKQFTFDNFGTRQQLSKINSQSKSLSVDNIIYKVTKAKVIKNTPKTAAAKQAVAQTLNLQSVPNQYYTFVINYTITNKQSDTIALNGINNVKTDQGDTLAVNNQLSDSSAGNHIEPNETKTFTTVGYLRDYANQPTNKVTLSFGDIYNLQGNKVSSAPTQGLTIDLN